MGDVLRGTLGVRAALALLFGLVSAAMVVLGAIMPRTTSAVVLVIFGGYALLDGLVAVFAARAATASRWLLALEPLVGIAAGIAAAVLVRQSDDLPAVLRGMIGGWAIASAAGRFSARSARCLSSSAACCWPRRRRSRSRSSGGWPSTASSSASCA